MNDLENVNWIQEVYDEAKQEETCHLLFFHSLFKEI